MSNSFSKLYGWVDQIRFVPMWSCVTWSTNVQLLSGNHTFFNRSPDFSITRWPLAEQMYLKTPTVTRGVVLYLYSCLLTVNPKTKNCPLLLKSGDVTHSQPWSLQYFSKMRWAILWDMCGTAIWFLFSFTGSLWIFKHPKRVLIPLCSGWCESRLHRLTPFLLKPLSGGLGMVLALVCSRFSPGSHSPTVWSLASDHAGFLGSFPV